MGHLPFVNMDGFMVQELSIENNRNSYWKSFRFDPFRWPYIYSNIRAWNSLAPACTREPFLEWTFLVVCRLILTLLLLLMVSRVWICNFNMCLLSR